MMADNFYRIAGNVSLETIGARWLSAMRSRRLGFVRDILRALLNDIIAARGMMLFSQGWELILWNLLRKDSASYYALSAYRTYICPQF